MIRHLNGWEWVALWVVWWVIVSVGCVKAARGKGGTYV